MGVVRRISRNPSDCAELPIRLLVEGTWKLSIRMLAENTGSNIVSLNCTSPQICNYDVWDGSKAFKYSGMDFTNGAIVINPLDSTG
jgi:hypothetical protein